MLFRVSDAGMAGKVSELFKIDFVLSTEDEYLLPDEILETIASTTD